MKEYIQDKSLVVRYPDPVEDEIAAEQLRQIRKFGLQNHAPNNYLLILSEEFGEAAREACDFTFEKDPYEKTKQLERLREELIQVAAVAKSFIECIDRGQF